MTLHDHVPANLQDAMSILTLRLVGPGWLYSHTQELIADNEESDVPVVQWITSDVGVLADLKIADTFVNVSQSVLNKWQVNLSDIIEACYQSIIDRDIAGALQVRKGIYVIQEPTLASLSMLYPHLLDVYKVKGDRVVFPVTFDNLVIMGTNDEKGVIKVLEQMRPMLLPLEYVVSAKTLQHVESNWIEYEWPVKPKLSQALHNYRAILTQRENLRFSSTFNDLHPDENDPYALNTDIATSPEGNFMTYASWFIGSDAFVPKVDIIFAVDEQGTTTPYDFEEFQNTLGENMQPMDTTPVSYRVPGGTTI